MKLHLGGNQALQEALEADRDDIYRLSGSGGCSSLSCCLKAL